MWCQILTCRYMYVYVVDAIGCSMASGIFRNHFTVKRKMGEDN